MDNNGLTEYDVELALYVNDTTDTYQDNIKTMLTNMFYMQAELNSRTNGEQWLTGITNKNRTIDWLTCFKHEMSEALDCFPWKHWKDIDKPVDVDNLVVEIVDSFHFIMSWVFEVSYNLKLNNEKFMINNRVTLPLGYTSVGNTSYDNMIKQIIDENISMLDLDNYYDEVNKLLYDYNTDVPDALSRMIMLAKRVAHNDHDVNDTIKRFTAFVITVMQEYSIPFDKLYIAYIAKNVLNIFRQDHGYMDGTYIKMWNGEEDNVYLTNILNEQTDNTLLTKEYIYNRLETKYKELV